MDDIKNQLVKDVAGLKQIATELGTLQITEARVREIVKEEMEAAKPPPETSKKSPFRLAKKPIPNKS